MHVDLSPLAQAGVQLLVYILGSAPFLALVSILLTRMLHVQKDSAASTEIDRAVKRAAGLTHDALMPLGTLRWDPVVRNKTIAGFMNYVVGRVPESLERKNVTLPVIEQMVTSELTRLEAVAGAVRPAATEPPAGAPNPATEPASAPAPAAAELVPARA